MATVSSCRYQTPAHANLRASSGFTSFVRCQRGRVSCVQVSEDAAGLAEDCMSGRSPQLSAAVVEVAQRYLSQFQLLSEIQALRSR